MRIIVAAALLALCIPAHSLAAEPKTEDDKTMYALGALVSRNFKEFKLSAAQVTEVQKGMSDSLAGKKLAIDMEKQTPKVQEYLKAYVPAHPGQPDTKAASATAAKPKPDQKTLYALGVLASKNLTDLSLTPAQVSMMEKGMADSLAGKKSAVDITAYEPKVQEFAKAKVTAAGDARKAKEAAGAAEYAAKPGAQKTASGLVYIPVEGRHGRLARPRRQGEGELRGQADGRHGVRQLLQAWPAHRVRPEPGHPLLDRGRAEDEGRRRGHAGLPPLHRLRRARRPRRHPAQRHPGLQGRAAGRDARRRPRPRSRREVT